MSFGRLVKSFTRKFGSRYSIYNSTGGLLGVENSFINPVKRSANENIAEFGRESIFHYQTLVQPGVRIVDTSSGEAFFVGAKRPIKLNSNVVNWSVFLVKINCEATIKRIDLTIVDVDTVDFSFPEVELYTKVPAYLRKEDWTMESMTSFGREQRGYETLVIQDSYDVAKEDLVYIEGKKFIMQDFVVYAKEGYHQIQLGLDV